MERDAQRVSSSSLRGLDAFAFFVADIQTGWGPFVAAYLTSVGWLQFDIIFHRMAILLGGSKAAWAIACVIQAALFGAIHAYQNPIGMLLTGTIGLISGIVFLAIGRNLWVPIIAHTLYDSARVVTFYLYGPPPR